MCVTTSIFDQLEFDPEYPPLTSGFSNFHQKLITGVYREPMLPNAPGPANTEWRAMRTAIVNLSLLFSDTFYLPTENPSFEVNRNPEENDPIYVAVRGNNDGNLTPMWCTMETIESIINNHISFNQKLIALGGAGMVEKLTQKLVFSVVDCPTNEIPLLSSQL